MHALNIATTNGYLDTKSRHPGLLAAAIVLHMGLLGAILSYHPELLVRPDGAIRLKEFPPIQPPPPKPDDQPKQKTKAEPQPQPDRPITIVEPLQPTREQWPEQPPMPPIGGGDGTGGTIEEVESAVLPILTGAGFDQRYTRDVQPPYPAALERQEIEGNVTVRVQIGPDGRVIAVELVRADEPAFFASTRDWALKRWRFKPATRDGVAVSSWLTKTVQFRIVHDR